MSLVQISQKTEAQEKTGRAPAFHVVDGRRRMLLVVNGSRLYEIEREFTDSSVADWERSLGHRPLLTGIPDAPAALSLNIAQSCNLSCRYCYADEGRFGGSAKLMSLETAKAAIRRHVLEATAKSVSIGYIGGEPLLNRPVLHAATHYAASEAARRGVAVTFGLTTNGTLLRNEDIELLRAYPYAVNVSLDGAAEVHDALRPAAGGGASFARVIAGVTPLLARPGQARVAARVTVTRRNMDVQAHIESLADAGFMEIGVSAMRTGPEEDLRIQGPNWAELLQRMQAAAEWDWARSRRTARSLMFSNFSTALRQLYRGACNALPCGAAANYVSLGADGRYYTCHRTVGDASLELGTLEQGPSLEARRAFTEARNVDSQYPCRACWARYLCGGGCHAEVIRMGREGCDFIRGWLEFCISTYPEVLAARRDLLREKAAKLP